MVALRRILSFAFIFCCVLRSAPPLRAQSSDDAVSEDATDDNAAGDNMTGWRGGVFLYGLGASMSGDVTIRRHTADFDMSFKDIVENLSFGAMGRAHLGYGRWNLGVDVIYVDLSHSTEKPPADVDMTQWIVEPTLGFQVTKWFEALAGARYNSLETELRFKGPLGLQPSGTLDWWDPIVGGRVTLPFAKRWSLQLRGDVGGFGAESEFAWQAEPMIEWNIFQHFSLLLGYRWLYSDYEKSEINFETTSLIQGPELGLMLRF